jgi:tRNA dimethylallyltransferase
VIVGPTAVGKTEVAVRLARHLPITVISADSRQIYRRLDIGTAKPTPQQLQSVTHVGIDIVDPGEAYSAGRFGTDAASWLRAIPGGTLPVVVGGTGFYVRALADGLFQEPPLDPKRRQQLREWTGSATGLGRWAKRLDPQFSGGGRQRAARSIEIALLTGRTLSWWQREAKAEGVMRPWYVRLTLPRPVLHRRIEVRCRRMLQQGLVDEVRSVLASGVSREARGLDAVGYPEVIGHLEGRITEAELASAISRSTRQYAKRQETWFRHQLGAGPVLVLDATEEPETLAEKIISQWEKRDEQCESE